MSHQPINMCGQQDSSEQQHPAKQTLRNKGTARHLPLEEDEQSNTRMKGLLPPKFKIQDEQATIKQTFSQIKKVIRRVSANAVPQTGANKNSLANQIATLKPLETSEKVQSILNSQSLRQKYATLLPTQHQLPIGYQHQKLIEKMKAIDRTMDFLLKNRSVKTIFFNELKKNMGTSLHLIISIDHIQQMLFLRQDSYNVFWEHNLAKKRYEIMVSLPKNFFDTTVNRYNELRKAIVDYLVLKEKQFLINNEEIKTAKKNNTGCWHKEFDYNRVQIPEKTLPANPADKGAQIRTMSNSQIGAIKDPKLSQIFFRKKKQSEVRSISSADVQEMIFSKVPGKKIEEQLTRMIKQTQRRKQEEAKLKAEQEKKMDKTILLRVCEEILFAYNARNISSMFTVSLEEVLSSKLRYTDDMIRKALEFILDSTQIGYLNPKQTHDGKKVTLICKKKFKEMRQHIQTSYEKQQKEVPK